jgi:hypothetical protein
MFEKNKQAINAEHIKIDFLFTCFVKMLKPINAIIHSNG